MKAAHRIHKWDRPPLYTIFFSTSPLPFFLSLVHDTVIGKRGRDVDLTGWLSLSGSFCSQPPWTEFQGGDPRCLLKLMKRPSLLVCRATEGGSGDGCKAVRRARGRVCHWTDSKSPPTFAGHKARTVPPRPRLA